jgi:hypothetical protein
MLFCAAIIFISGPGAGAAPAAATGPHTAAAAKLAAAIAAERARQPVRFMSTSTVFPPSRFWPGRAANSPETVLPTSGKGNDQFFRDEIPLKVLPEWALLLHND